MSSIVLPFRLSAIFRQLRPIHRSHRALLSTSPPHHSLIPNVASTPQCPPSSCSCAAMPSGLAIDHEKPLSGTMPPYAQHVVIRTGKNYWSSKIEDEPEMGGGVNFASELKKLVGRGGKLHDPSRPVLITNSSEPLPYAGNAEENQDFHAVHVYPQNISVSAIPRTAEGHEQFAETFLASPARNTSQGDQDMSHGTASRPEEQRGKHLQWDPIPSASILICGHNSRDTRCGILGPLLETEFKKHIVDPSCLPPIHTSDNEKIGKQQLIQEKSNQPHASVALISHIGGHKFAGNVVIYFPRTWRVGDGERSLLAGKGVWYGRVEPRHVWGIVEETVKGGRVVEELCRGVHMGEDGVVMRNG